jgi:prephenate dehydrogenase
MKIAIIGGGGKMGQWLCRFLQKEGLDIILADIDIQALKAARGLEGTEIAMNSREAVGKADVIIISVPIGSFEQVVKEIAPFIRLEQIVIDITSIKAAPVEIMHKYIKKGMILGTHPLFGPGVNIIRGQNFVLTPVNDREKALAARVEKYLVEHGANVKCMAPEAHDRMMAVTQGLSHFVAIISADALSGLGKIEEMREVSTTTFGIFLNYIESVIGEDAALYAAIQMAHPEMADIYKILVQSVERWADMVKRKDTQGFIERMGALNSFIGDKG